MAASFGGALKTERETLRKKVDQTRCDRVPVLSYIITCWPVCLKDPRPGHTYESYPNENLTADHSIFKTIFDFTIFRDLCISRNGADYLTKSCSGTLPSCQGSIRTSW